MSDVRDQFVAATDSLDLWLCVDGNYVRPATTQETELLARLAEAVESIERGNERLIRMTERAKRAEKERDEYLRAAEDAARSRLGEFGKFGVRNALLEDVAETARTLVYACELMGDRGTEMSAPALRLALRVLDGKPAPYTAPGYCDDATDSGHSSSHGLDSR